MPWTSALKSESTKNPLKKTRSNSSLTSDFWGVLILRKCNKTTFLIKTSAMPKTASSVKSSKRLKLI